MYDIVIIFRDTCTHNTRCSYTVKNAHAEMETFVIQTYYEIKLFLWIYARFCKKKLLCVYISLISRIDMYQIPTYNIN